MFLQVIIPVIWISVLISITPSFSTSDFDKENEFCTQQEWILRAFSVAWSVLLGALPMLNMTGLYSKVIYSL